MVSRQGGSINQKKNEDSKSKERVYMCRKCPNNHLGKDCDGNMVECHFCGKLGYREFECYAQQRHPNQKKWGATEC